MFGLNSTRRGFFGGILGGTAALQGLLTGATPPVVPSVKVKPIDPKQARLYEFLMGMYQRDKEFFLQGDIGGFTQSMNIGFERDVIEVTAFGDEQRRFIPGYQRVDVELSMPLESAAGRIHEFKLCAFVNEASTVSICKGEVINPDDLPKRSCMVPFGLETMETVVLAESRFRVRSVDLSIY